MSFVARLKKLFERKTGQPNIERKTSTQEEEATQELGDEAMLDYHCEQIVDATYQMEDLKLEYELVTSYFSDIQKIEQLTPEYQHELEDIARKIQKLEQDRQEYQREEAKLPMAKYNQMLRYEKETPDAIRRLYELENMRGNIKHDMEKLEGEKGALEYQEESLADRQNSMKTLTIAFAVLAILCLGVFALIASQYRLNMEIPSMLIIMVALIVGVAMFFTFRRIEYESKICYLKHNRAITLMNKVKIKWINNTNSTDYLHEKYQINSVKELEFLWEQYRIMVEEQRKYQQNTGDLQVYCDELCRILEGIGVKDSAVWCKQTMALIDKREMVEVKHNLNVRRQKLREQMTYNETVRRNSFDSIRAILSKKPQLKEHVKTVLTSYHIEI